VSESYLGFDNMTIDISVWGYSYLPETYIIQ